MQHSALYRAVKRVDVIEVRRLLSAGCDANESSGGFETALTAAAARGNTPVIRLLLDAGATPTWQALYVAAFGNHVKAYGCCWQPVLPSTVDSTRTDRF